MHHSAKATLSTGNSDFFVANGLTSHRGSHIVYNTQLYSPLSSTLQCNCVHVGFRWVVQMKP